MSRYDYIDPMDIDPDTNMPYAGYSSPSIDTSFYDLENDQPDLVCDLIEAARALLPTNVSLTNPNIRDRQTLPVDISVGALRKLAKAIAAIEGGAA